MNTRSTSPGRRLALAGLGYLLIFAAPYWVSGGPLSALSGAALYVVAALALLKAALPMAAVRRTRKGDELHPVQAGKAPLLRRRQQLVWGRA